MKTLQERLGYPKETKLLIIHADDIGVAQTENAATIYAMEKGVVNSGSIMVPCPWFPEIAAYAVSHPELDLGVHLVLTSEWKHYKWGPVLHQEVKSLTTDKGFLTDGSVDLSKVAKVEDVEKELRAQIKRAIQFGVDPTHLDSHMGMIFRDAEYVKIYIKLGHEFKIPVMITQQIVDAYESSGIKKMLTEKDVVIDDIYTAATYDYAKGMSKYYTNLLNNLQPGVSTILIHTAYDNDEMKAVTIDHPDWGSAWRQADFDFFTSDVCKKLLETNNIQLITWREMRDKLVR
ncbi:polysaccharide deacetylase family protein [Pseudochryseolinea flava]|nr:polysaccharide deacetylase family protein [Pseudochryseolinea flava]